MQGLSFREYLMLFHKIESPLYSLREVLQHQVKIPDIEHPLPLFKDYLKQGYYPFALENNFGLKLKQVIIQTLESDIPAYAAMHVSTGRKLKQLLTIIAQSVPFKPNMSKIAEMLNISRNNIAYYLQYIEDAGLIMQLRSPTDGIRALGKVEKVYLENTNLIYSLALDNENKGNARETYFFNQLKQQYAITASKQADFRVDDIDFEVGGKQKNLKQLNNAQNGIVVKDDIETGYLNTVPLWQFGLLY